MKTIQFLQAELQLQRYPVVNNPTLQAWDAADELVLNWLHENPPADSGRILVAGDQFGAIGCAAAAVVARASAGWEIDWHNDSLLAETAVRKNLRANNIPAESLRICPQLFEDPSPGRLYDLVLLRLPRQTGYLEYLLHSIRRHLAPGGRIIAGGMVKHTPPGVLDLLVSIIGPADRSLAQKKARVFCADYDQNLDPPVYEPLRRELWGDYTIAKLPNTFARQGIDAGTAVLLEYLDENAPCLSVPRVLDLGCGSGILSLAAAHWYPEAEILAVDESYLAVQSARRTMELNNVSSRVRCEVMDGGCLHSRGVHSPGEYGLVLCNPPFHQNGTVIRTLAQRMMASAAALLAPGSSVLLVANASLGYQGVLQNYFATVKTVRKNTKFVVLQLIPCAVG